MSSSRSVRAIPDHEYLIHEVANDDEEDPNGPIKVKTRPVKRATITKIKHRLTKGIEQAAKPDGSSSMQVFTFKPDRNIVGYLREIHLWLREKEEVRYIEEFSDGAKLGFKARTKTNKWVSAVFVGLCIGEIDDMYTEEEP